MQLDKTHVAIRERRYLDLLDLAILVIRRHALALSLIAAAGAAPMMLINYLLLGDWAREFSDYDALVTFDFGYATGYACVLGLLVLVEMPLATAPITLYIGQVVFEEKPSARRLISDLLKALPQLLIGQVSYRALLLSPLLVALMFEALAGLASLLIVTGVFLVLHVATRPYLNEIILLEQNPWRTRDGSNRPAGTLQRNRALHARQGGEHFGWWLVSMMIGTIMMFAIWLSLRFVRGVLANNAQFDVAMWTIYLQLAIWIVVSYFTVARYLGYLDTRIRNEGWEVELRLRAEASRLESQLA